ncbi:MAG: CDP-alcohol phosphatidyltransferase family protein [Myxococcota bacterium]
MTAAATVFETIGATAPLVILPAEDGPRVVGLPARERNARVVERVKAEEGGRQDLEAAAADRPTLVVPPDVTFTPALVEALPTPDRAVRVEAGEGGPALVWGPAGAVREALDSAAGLPRWEAPAGAVLPLSDDEARRAARDALLRQAQKPTDGVVSRNLNRPVSRFFSRIFLGLGMNPDHASVVSLTIGLACAWFAAQEGWWTMALAGLLFQTASAFDGVDGEMARVRLAESPRGAWIDTAVDNVTYVACLVGVTIGWIREDPGTFGLALAGVVLVGVPAVLGMLVRFVRRYGEGSLVFVDRTVARAAEATGRPSLRLARLFFLALRRDVFALLFFFVSLTGSRAAVPAMVAVGLAGALLTFGWHRRRLVDAARDLAAEAP